MHQQIDLIILTGEPSGDLHAATLIEALLNQNPNLRIAAVAGPHMRRYPITTLFQMETLQVMGFTDVFLALPRLIRQFFRIKKAIMTLSPKAVITVDYPGLHLRLARSLRKAKFKGTLIHYICPSVWAWGKKRISFMAKYFDLLLTLFPFEPPCFAGTELRVVHVGHPLVGQIPPPQPAMRAPLLALFPGSRPKEVENNFPLQLRVAQELLKENAHMKMAVSIAHSRLEPLIRRIAGDTALRYVSPDQTRALMAEARLAIAKSGTVNLELALHETPTIVTYAIGAFDLFLAQKIFKINLPHYSLPNIIAQKRVYPELFGPELTFDRLLQAAQMLWVDESARRLCTEGCREVRQRLGDSDTSAVAAAIISTAHAERDPRK